MTTRMPTDVARKQPAEVIATQPLPPNVIDGQVVRKTRRTVPASAILLPLLVLLGLLFAGFLLAMVQQAS